MLWSMRPGSSGRSRGVPWLLLASIGLLGHSTRAAPGDPPVSGVRLIGLSGDNTLLVFDAGRPAEVRTVKVGRVGGTLLGIDFRPADGRLYGLTSANNLYALDPATGAASLVSTLTVPFDGGVRSGLDFNPQSDRLRLVGSNGQNLRVHPDLGASASDGALAYARGDRHFGRKPAVTACAYTSSVARAPSTRTFDIDPALDVLVLQEPPNDGLLKTVGPLGVDFGVVGGFDILTDAAGRDHGFAVSGQTLYRVDLATGAAAPLGTIGGGRPPLIGLAAASGPASK